MNTFIGENRIMRGKGIILLAFLLLVSVAPIVMSADREGRLFKFFFQALRHLFMGNHGRIAVATRVLPDGSRSGLCLEPLRGHLCRRDRHLDSVYPGGNLSFLKKKGLGIRD